MRDKKILVRPRKLGGFEMEDLHEEVDREYKRRAVKSPKERHYTPRDHSGRELNGHPNWSRYLRQARRE